MSCTCNEKQKTKPAQGEREERNNNNNDNKWIIKMHNVYKKKKEGYAGKG